MVTFKGYDVLTVRSNAREEPSDKIPRQVRALDYNLGKRNRTANDKFPKVGRSFLWTCKTLAELTVLKAFFAARMGKTVPFWMPTWREDLTISMAALAAATSISIVRVGYTDYAYQHKARRYLQIREGSNIVYIKVTGSANADETTEVLTFENSIGMNLSLNCQISYLTLCRLDTDELAISHKSNGLSETTFDYIEIPEETPA